MNHLLDLIVGIMALLIVIYRSIVIMIPMIKTGIKNKDIYKIFSAFTLLV